MILPQKATRRNEKNCWRSMQSLRAEWRVSDVSYPLGGRFVQCLFPLFILLYYIYVWRVSAVCDDRLWDRTRSDCSLVLKVSQSENMSTVVVDLLITFVFWPYEHWIAPTKLLGRIVVGRDSVTISASHLSSQPVMMTGWLADWCLE